MTLGRKAYDTRSERCNGTKANAGVAKATTVARRQPDNGDNDNLRHNAARRPKRCDLMGGALGR